jgi:ribonuclease P protein component
MVRPGRILLRFPKTARLNRASEFALLKTEGKSWTGKHLTLATLARGEETRIGIITSRRLGSAVVRNKIRRRIREIFRLNQHRLRRGVWLVIVARSSSVRASYDDLLRDWLRLAERASIFLPRHPDAEDPAQSL